MPAAPLPWVDRMPQALFLSSTPLHSLWALGIGVGAFRDWQCSLVLIDQRKGDRDCIADALSKLDHPPFVEVVRFEQIGKRPQQKIARARPQLRRVQDYVRTRNPQYIAVGNDRRAEFHAALQAAPGAVGAYMDDGASSYVSGSPGTGGALRRVGEAFGQGVRRLVYGVNVEHPPLVGGSRAAKEAWLLLPELAHAPLAAKQPRAIESVWFREPLVQEVCAAAIAQAGLDAGRLAATKLLLVLPHDSVLRAQPQLRERLEQMAREHAAKGQQVAYKFHPRSQAAELQLPPGCIEIPRRLPVEILAPLLSDTLVVGSLTAALIFLLRLGARIEVRALAMNIPPDNPVLQVYRRMGIQILE